MRYQEEIDLRQSRRTYDGTLLTDIQQDQLEQRIALLNERYGLSCCLIKEGASVFKGFKNSYGLFKGVRSFLWLQGPKSDENLEEKCGYAGEELVLEATRMNLGSCWVKGTFDQNSPLLQTVQQNQTVAVIPIGKTGQFHWKEKWIHQALNTRRKKWKELCVVEGKAPDWFYEGVQAAAKAPSALMRQKTRFFFRGGQVMAVTEDEIASDRIDLGIAKFHFECAADGNFDLGNPAVFHKKKESDLYDSNEDF